jgi:hypothetical protein
LLWMEWWNFPVGGTMDTMVTWLLACCYCEGEEDRNIIGNLREKKFWESELLSYEKRWVFDIARDLSALWVLKSQIKYDETRHIV